MEKLMSLLEEGKCDEVIDICTDGSSYKHMAIKAFAHLYKREYKAFSDAYVSAINLAKNLALLEEINGMDIVDLYGEVRRIAREEAKDTLTEFIHTDDSTLMLKVPEIAKKPEEEMKAVIEAANSYASMPEMYSSLPVSMHFTYTEIALDVIDACESYFNKINDEHRAFYAAVKPEVDLALLQRIRNMKEKVKYLNILAVRCGAGFLDIVTQSYSPDVIDTEQVKATYLKLIDLLQKMLNANNPCATGATYLLDYNSDVRKNTVDSLGACMLKLKALDPEYQMSPLPPVNDPNAPAKPASTGNSTNSSGGCYVATAVYGSYDCPEVWTLRRYRDNTMSKSVFGRLFIRTYYAISPTIVRLFGNYKWFTGLWRRPLDKMVNKLNNNGVENTPYDDKEW